MFIRSFDDEDLPELVTQLTNPNNLTLQEYSDDQKSQNEDSIFSQFLDRLEEEDQRRIW